MNNIINNLNPPYKDLAFLIHLYKEGKFQDVLDQSDKMILKYSYSMKLHNLRGTVNALLKRFDEAIECYKKALKTDPNYSVIYNNLANVFKEKGNFKLSIQNYKQAIKLNPIYAEAYKNIGFLYFENGYTELAKQSFIQAISLKPKYAESFYGLGLSFERNGEFLLAVKNYENALESNPNYPDVFFSLGNIYRNMGDYEIATRNYLKAINLKSNFFEAYSNLGNTKKDLGDVNSAKLYYKKALEINPQDFQTLWNIHGVSVSVKEAIKWLSKCLKVNKNCKKTKLMLSALKYLKNDKIDFQNLASSTLGSHPFMRSFIWVFQQKETPKLLFDKFSFFDYIIEKSPQDRPFYEFGVWKGVSFRYLIKSLKKGIGFDTFKGLPESWYNEKPGTYSSQGVIPKIKGGKFIVGKFNETLPKFFNETQPLASIINLDADLYSSTLCALKNCINIIDKRTILIFDEFLMSDNWEEDEFKALNEFCKINKFSYKVIAVSFFSKQVAVKLTPNSK